MAASTASTSFTAGERYVLDRARRLAAAADSAAICEYVGEADSAFAYAEAFGQARYLLAELVAIVERLSQ